jgi:hypothetical protein
MPTVDEPKLQAPMEAANPAPLQDGKTIVATQPVRHYFSCFRHSLNTKTNIFLQRSEPRPTMENEMTLRGGGMSHYCGFSCCKGRCNFRLC